MELESERYGGRYRYVAACEQGELADCPGTPSLELNDGLYKLRCRETVRLGPRSDLFTAYQRSFSDEHQAVLARWAAGDFRAGDGRLSAAESPLERCDEDDAEFEEPVSVCAHPQLFYRVLQQSNDSDETSEDDTDGGSSESEDEEQEANL